MTIRLRSVAGRLEEEKWCHFGRGKKTAKWSYPWRRKQEQGNKRGFKTPPPGVAGAASSSSQGLPLPPPPAPPALDNEDELPPDDLDLPLIQEEDYFDFCRKRDLEPYVHVEEEESEVKDEEVDYGTENKDDEDRDKAPPVDDDHEPIKDPGEDDDEDKGPDPSTGRQKVSRFNKPQASSSTLGASAKAPPEKSNTLEEMDNVKNSRDITQVEAILFVYPMLLTTKPGKHSGDLHQKRMIVSSFLSQNRSRLTS